MVATHSDIGNRTKKGLEFLLPDMQTDFSSDFQSSEEGNAYQLYLTLHQGLNGASRVDEGVLIGLVDESEVKDMISNVNGKSLDKFLKQYGHNPSLDSYAFNEYLNMVAPSPGAILIDYATGEVVNDTVLIEGVNRSLEDIAYEEKRGARHTAAMYASHFTNGTWFIVSEENKDLTILKNGEIAYRAGADSEELSEERFNHILEQYSSRDPLPKRKNTHERKIKTNYGEFLEEAFFRAVDYVKDHDEGLLMLIGDEKHISKLTTPLNGDLIDTHYLQLGRQAPNLYSEEVDGLLNLIAEYDGAVAFDPDGEAIGTKLFINGVTTKGGYEKIDGEGLRPWAASFISQYGVGAIVATKYGNVYGFENGELVMSNLDRSLEESLNVDPNYALNTVIMPRPEPCLGCAGYN